MTNMTNIDNYAFNSDEIAIAVELEQERELDDYLASSEVGVECREEDDEIALAVEMEQERELDDYLASSEPTADDLDYLREMNDKDAYIIDEECKLSALLADVRAIMSPILAQYDNEGAPF